jgi:hypothetical protein
MFALVLCGVMNAATVQDFNGGAGQTPYTLTRYQGSSDAVIVNNALRMVNTTGQKNVIAFNQTDPGLYGRIVAEWDLSIVPGADGLGFALLNTANYGTSGAGPAIDEEPSLNGSFGVGFDIYCPDDYQRKGSHEISLHWNGVERENKWSSYDYRTGTFRRVRVVVDFVPGGAEITVSVAGTVVYDRYFMAGMMPYDCRVAFGARTGGYMTTLYLDNVNVSFENPTQTPEPPVSIRTFNRKLMNGAYRDVDQVFSFPSENTIYERVVMTLTVEEPPGGWDPWDRMMGIYIWDEAQQNRYEIARFMTPYSKAGVWYFDVTDYQTLLRGNRKMAMWLDSWVGGTQDQKGYWITTDFDYYKGDPKWRIVGIQNLWKGTPTYGAGSDPQMTNFFAARQIPIPSEASKTKLRFMVTGHGQSPNTGSGAEFIRRGRTVTANAGSYYNMLWRDDCYLNPCRPQGGTWQYSRAGWAPGDKTNPWEVDISGDVVPGQTAVIGYTADEYINTSPDWGNVSRHWVESQIVFYEPCVIDRSAHWQFNDGGGSVALDSSGNELHGTLKNMNASNWTGGKHCGGLYFDGVNDYVEISGFKGITGSSSRTCSAWIKTTRPDVQILSWGIAQVESKWVIRTNGDGTLRAEVQGGYIYGTTPIADGNWHHIAVTLHDDSSANISEALLFVDGQLEAVGGVSPCPIRTIASTNVKIGVHSTGLYYFEGFIDEVRIYNYALTDAEIQDLYRTHALIADMEPDGDVDFDDFAHLAHYWQNTDSCDGDLTCDCIVDFDDLMILVEEWLHYIPF